MIRVEQGGEYPGETYIWCDQHCPGRPVTEAEVSEAMFELDSLEDLEFFIAAHRECDGQPRG